MKTLQLGSIAFAFLCLFNSCTKDSQQVNQNDSSTNAAKSVIPGAGNPNTGGSNGQGNPTPGNGDLHPTLSVTYAPTITNDPPTATVGAPVTVTGSITSTPAPSCGKLQLQENINGTWQTVKTENVTETNKSVTFSFTPPVTGTYEFQVHYVASTPGEGSCDGYGESLSDVFPLLVVEACKGLDITGKVDGVPQPVAGTDRYQFKVVYEVTTCGLQFDKLKVQGGLTNGVSSVTSEGGLQRVPGNSTNKVITWEEYTPGVLLPTTKRTYTITFEKAYSGTGTIELTGDWSVSLSLNGTDAGRDSFEKIYYTK